MGLQVKYNRNALEASLTQIGDRAVKGMSDRMRKRAILIRDLARAYAPYNTGLLERSIDYETIRQGGRNAYVVYIDVDAARTTGRGQLGDYAWIMHTQLRPYGNQGKPYQLGPGSRAKGRKVGGLFLTRAIKDGMAGLMEEMGQAVRQVTGGGPGLLSTKFKRPARGGDDE